MQTTLTKGHKFPNALAFGRGDCPPPLERTKMSAKQKTSPNALAFGKGDCPPRLMARKPARHLSA